MQITWEVEGTEVEVWISNIQWDNDSIGMSEAWGFLKDDNRDDYISDFDVDHISFEGSLDKEAYNEQCDAIGKHDWHNDLDFIAKIEEADGQNG